VIATLALPPARAVEEGWLRRDLFERLGGQTIEMPPLRERLEDIPALVEHFLDSFCRRRCGCIFGASEAALDALAGHDWPGNVRELRDVIHHAVTTGASGWIEPSDLPPPMFTEAPASTDGSEAPLPTLAEAEAILIRMALERAGGNKSLAAQMLGISRHKLYDRLRHSPESGRTDRPSEPDSRHE
jgi:transcriptional regulator with PAS, ATPase and Fis domain